MSDSWVLSGHDARCMQVALSGGKARLLWGFVPVPSLSDAAAARWQSWAPQ